MHEKDTHRYQNKIITIPNILSMFRVLLVPVFCWTYLFLKDNWLTAGVLVLSGLTDVADGIIARRFDMISDFGKLLDPIADKLTQAAVLICLIFRYPIMLPAFVALAIKEVMDGITGLIVMKRTGTVPSARWHGKLATVLLYATMTLHVVWPAIPEWLTLTLTIICVVSLLLSTTLYTLHNRRWVREYLPHKEEAPPQE